MSCRQDDAILDDLQSASHVLRNLKSRGVTRFLDLSRANKRNIDDVESDEQEGDDGDSDAEEMAKRRRTGVGSLAEDNDYDMSGFIQHLILRTSSGCGSGSSDCSNRRRSGGDQSAAKRGPATSARK